MEKFTTLTGVAAPLKMINVDTDMIIPKQFLKTIKRTGLGKGLFSEMRYTRRRQGKSGFRAEQARLSQGEDPGGRRQFRLRLVARACAVGAARFRHPLRDLHLFADIFYNNCFKNGILPIKVRPEDLEKLFDDAERGANATLTIDLEKQEIRGPDGGVDPVRYRSVPQALPAQRARRHRADHGEEHEDRRLRA